MDGIIAWGAIFLAQDYPVSFVPKIDREFYAWIGKIAWHFANVAVVLA